MTRERAARISAFIAVHVLLFLIDWLSQLYRSRETEFLLVPPLAVIIYLIFSRPHAASISFRSIVVTPVLASAIGVLCYRYVGLTPGGVALATLAVLLVQLVLRSYMPPALALALLAMLLKAQGFGFGLGVGLATLFTWAIFMVWRRYVWLPLPAANATPATTAQPVTAAQPAVTGQPAATGPSAGLALEADDEARRGQ